MKSGQIAWLQALPQKNKSTCAAACNLKCRSVAASSAGLSSTGLPFAAKSREKEKVSGDGDPSNSSDGAERERDAQVPVQRLNPMRTNVVCAGQREMER